MRIIITANQPIFSRLVNFLLIFFGLVISDDLIAKDLDYTIYHKKINQAEEYYFVENNPKQALELYDEVFLAYSDFIFVKDLLNAAQIATFEKLDPKKYIIEAYRFGFKSKYLQEYPILSSLTQKYLKDKQIIAQEQKGNKEYYSKINLGYLSWIYQLAVDDYNAKNKRDKYYFNTFIPRYITILENKINTIGFPGEKILGINEIAVFSEMGKDKNKDYSNFPELNNMMIVVSWAEKLSVYFVFPFILHNECAFGYFEDIFYREIKKGNMHPRDAALIFDDNLRYQKILMNKDYNPYSCKGNKVSYDYFYMMTYRERSDKLSQSQIDKINEKRALLNICSVEVDKAKMKYVNEHNFKLFSGYIVHR